MDRVLGVGGMAAVFAATHVHNGRRVAIKLLHLEFSNNAEVRTRFLREGYLANKLEHPGSVAVLDNDVTEDGSAFIVMELLEGETLEDRRERSGTLPVHEVLSLADRLLDVLAAAHDRGIVHRDIKPENVFLTHEGNVKVLDFGIARMRELQSARLTLTTSGAIGTPAFMPPEQARGRWDEVGPQSDIWSVGATMFTLLAGRLVHHADTVNELMLAAMTKPAPALASVVPGVPPGVARLVDTALAYDAKQRWPNARSMQAALRAAYQSLDRMSLPGPQMAMPMPYMGDPASGVYAPGALMPSPSQVAMAAPVSVPGGYPAPQPPRPMMPSVAAMPVGMTGHPVTMVGATPARSGPGAVLTIVGAAIGALVVGGALFLFVVRSAPKPHGNDAASSASAVPAATGVPSTSASASASAAPSAEPSAVPSAEPSAVPSAEPSPSGTPSSGSTAKPVNRPGKFLRNPKAYHH